MPAKSDPNYEALEYGRFEVFMYPCFVLSVVRRDFKGQALPCQVDFEFSVAPLLLEAKVGVVTGNAKSFWAVPANSRALSSGLGHPYCLAVLPAFR